MSQDKEVANEIRIGITSKPKDIISKCEKLLKEDKVKDLHLSAVGNSIGELVIYVEILKSIFPKLSQKSVFSTITPAPSKKEKKTDDKTQKLLPKLEVIVSTEKEKDKKEGSETKLTEEERKTLIGALDKKKLVFIRRRRYFRNSYRNNRRRGYNERNQNYSYFPRRTNFVRGRRGYSNRRTQYGKSPITRKNNNMRKVNGNTKESQNKQVTGKN